MQLFKGPLLLALCLSIAWQDRAVSDPPAAAPDSGAIGAFEWFSTLGFPDVRGCPVARSIPKFGNPAGSWPQIGFAPAFLLRQGDDGLYTVLTPDLFTLSFHRTGPGTPENPVVPYEEQPLARAADAYLDEFTHQSKDEIVVFQRGFGRRLSEPATIFVWAWACWRNGLDERAARLYALAVAAPDRRGRKPDVVSFRQRLEQDLGEAMIWRATLDFGDPKIPRTKLLDSFVRVARDYPSSEYAASADETVKLLRTMVAEDEAHAAKASGPLENMPPEQRIAELIFRLRDQNGVQASQPGYCSIFTRRRRTADQEEDSTPADQLAALGYAAVPQLIAALEDKRFSRSVGFGRDFVFSHYVLTVGDCADQILERIATRRFFVPRTSSYMSKDGAVALVKAAAQTWWQEVAQKGEEQTLIDSVSLGGANAGQQAEVLLKRYPDDALAPIIQGAKNSARERPRLVGLAGMTSGDGALPFLEEELRHGPHLADRVAAADALRLRGHVQEATTAMMAEWEKLRNVRAGQENEPDNLSGGVIHSLCHCRRADAIEALGHDLRGRSTRVRMDVVNAMRPPDFGLASPGPRASTDPAVEAAAEALLASELDDTNEVFGLTTWFSETPTYAPRLCDVAAVYLAARFPGKYSFDIAGSLKQRERLRVACQNVWRGEHGDPLLPAPPEYRVEPAPAGTVLPILRRLSSSSDVGARLAAVADLAELGLPALAPLQAFAASLPADDPGRARLEVCEKNLACIVIETTLQDLPATADAAWRQGMQDHLRVLEGQPLTSSELVALAMEVAWKVPKQSGGFALQASRDEDFGGFRILLKLDAPGRMDADQSRQVKSEHVSVGTRTLWGATGNASLDELRTWNSYQESARLADQALDAPAQKPVILEILVDQPVP